MSAPEKSQPIQDNIIQEIKTLKNNKYFRHFIFLYLQFAAEPEDPEQWPTVSELISNVETALPNSPILNDKQKIDNEIQRQDFFKKMQMWRDLIVSGRVQIDANLDDALRHTLYTIKIVDKFP